MTPPGGANAGARAPVQPTALRPKAVTIEPWSDLAAALDDIGSERHWFAEDAIDPQATVLLIGPEKGCKSWMLLDLAVATVTGGKWLGAFQIKQPGPVVYVDAEMREHEFARRLARIARGHGHDPKTVAGLVKHITPGWKVLDSNMYRTEKGGKSSEQARARDFTDAVQRVEPVLTIFDPLRNLISGNENSVEFMASAFDSIAAYRANIGCVCVVAHHLNKAGTSSGHRSSHGFADLILEGSDERPPWFNAVGRTLRRDDAIGKGFTVAVQHTHDSNDATATSKLALRFAGGTHSTVSLPRPEQRVLDALRAAPGDGLMLPNEVRKQTKQNHNDVTKALAGLKASGLIEQQGRHYALATREFAETLLSDARAAKGEPVQWSNDHENDHDHKTTSRDEREPN